jgi:diphthamide synthase (EF-2-diphthine--ammonia ligase)
MVDVLRRQGVRIGGLLTTINGAFDRVAMHGVRTELVHAQAASLRLPLWTVPLPYPCPNEVYERTMADVVRRAVSEGFTQMAFGDLFLEDVRRYREERLTGTGLTPVFPLFGSDTAALAAEMLRGGLESIITCLNPAVLDRAFIGRRFDARLLADIPASVDPCGERGEFHTFACRGPMFETDIAVELGAVVDRDGFVFADLQPAKAAST